MGATCFFVKFRSYYKHLRATAVVADYIQDFKMLSSHPLISLEEGPVFGPTAANFDFSFNRI
jgi:hypothetical protein